MALAESTHHPASRGQKKVRAREEVRVEEHGQVPEEAPLQVRHAILDAMSWARDVAVVRAMLVLLLKILLALCCCAPPSRQNLQALGASEGAGPSLLRRGPPLDL